MKRALALIVAALPGCGFLFPQEPNVNGQPVAVAEVVDGKNIVDGGAQVTLTAEHSKDPDGSRLRYKWEQVAGTQVTVDDLNAARITFKAPELATTLVFSLVVNDGVENSLRALVEISVLFNRAPVADAGAPVVIPNLSSATLNAAGTDPDGDPIVAYEWTILSQPLGATYAVSGTDSAHPNFRPLGKGTYTLGLRVSDGKAWSQRQELLLTAVDNPPAISTVAPVIVTDNTQPALLTLTATDVDGDPITEIQWTLDAQPLGSVFSLVPLGNQATFTPQGRGTYVVLARARDSEGAWSAPLEFRVVAENVRPEVTLPVLDAVVNYSTAYLVSNASDADGDLLSYQWRIVSRPAGATAILQSGVPAPAFQPAGHGSYLVEVVVSDGLLASLPATAAVTVLNTKPVATAGSGASVPNHTQVALSGSSSDADDDAIVLHAWAVESAPLGSTYGLSGTTSAFPAFTPHGIGQYTLSYRVSDGMDWSKKSFVQVNALNNAPTVTPAATLVTTDNNQTVNLSALANDPDGDTVTRYEWTVVSQPIGASFDLAGASTLNASLTPHGKGTYQLSFRAGDATAWSEPTFISVTARNVVPVAAILQPAPINNAETTYLDGTPSNDSDGDPLIYRWSVTSRPAGSTFTLQNGVASPAFTPRGKGTYVLQLKVSDGTGESTPVTAAAEVLNSPPVAAPGGPYTGLTVGTTFYATGRDSADPDNDTLTYTWQLLPDPTLYSGRDVYIPAPSSLGTYTLYLEVSDGTASHTKTTSVVVDNRPPVAGINAPSIIPYGTPLVLDGSASSDPDGNVLMYQWTQIDGPLTNVSGGNGAAPTVTLLDWSDHITYQLKVSDGKATSEPVTVRVEVSPSDAIAVFVDDDSPIAFPTESWHGSATAPVSQISGGIGVAQNDDKKFVVVAGGTYNERINLSTGINVMGGYVAGSWARDLATAPTFLSVSQFCDSIIEIQPTVTTPPALIDGFRIPTHDGGFNCNEAVVTAFGSTTMRNMIVEEQSSWWAVISTNGSRFELTDSEITIGSESGMSYNAPSIGLWISTGMSEAAILRKNVLRIYDQAKSTIDPLNINALEAEVEGNTFLYLASGGFGQPRSIQAPQLMATLNSFKNNGCFVLVSGTSVSCLRDSGWDMGAEFEIVNNTFFNASGGFAAAMNIYSQAFIANNYYSGWNALNAANDPAPSAYWYNVILNTYGPALPAGANALGNQFVSAPCQFVQTVDPDLPGYYRLDNGPCIDAGYSNAATVPAADIDGVVRYDDPTVANALNGLGVDAGWSEYRP